MNEPKPLTLLELQYKICNIGAPYVKAYVNRGGGPKPEVPEELPGLLAQYKERKQRARAKHLARI